MKRYTKKSKVKEIKIFRSVEKEVFYAEVITDPKKVIDEKLHKELIAEVDRAVDKSWGKFEEEYLINSIIDSKYLLLLRNKEKALVGVAPIKKLKIDDRDIYSFGLTVVDPDYRGLGFMRKMHSILVKKVFLENLLKGRTKVEFIFITPNIKTLSSLARSAYFMYPNPYLYNEHTGGIPKADEITWETVKKFLKASKENYRYLNPEGCVMEGFYDNQPHLIKNIDNSSSDKKLHMFGEKYLKPGSEIVVRAIIDIKGIISG